MGSLTVTKNVSGDTGYSQSLEFPVTITFTVPTGKSLSGVTVTGGTLNGNVVTASLADGKSVTVSDIPEGVTYVVTEGTSPDANYALDTIVYGDTSKAISDGDTDTVDVNNTYTKPADKIGDLEVTKVVTGTNAPASVTFPITVVLTNRRTWLQRISS